MILRRLLRRPFTSNPITHKPLRPSLRNSSSSKESRTRARLNNLHSRLPRFLHPYTNALLSAPLTHIISFLILHEITAVVPLVGLASLFHYTNWVPVPGNWVEGRWVKEGVERFGGYFGRKGWFGVERVEGNGGEEGGMVESGKDGKTWMVGEKGGRILVEVASAYAITKVFLPARIVLSVWGTPWFARVFVGRFMGLFKGVKGNRNVVNGLGASAGGVGGGVGKGVEKSVKKIPP